jgi:hypothetical protein
MSGRPSIGDDGDMPGFNGVIVDAPEGPRWELALTLIDSGEGPVRLGVVEIWRNVAGPTADGMIRMTIRVGEHADREGRADRAPTRQAGS